MIQDPKPPTPETVAVRSTIRTFALIVVAILSGFVMYMVYWMTEILSSPDWCSKAIQAERITPGASFEGLTGCIDILELQLQSLATNSHIGWYVTGTCLVALMLIVVAGGRLSFKGNKDGVEGNLGRDSSQEQKIEGEVTLTPKG